MKQLLASDGGFLNPQDLLSHIWGLQVSVEVWTVDPHIVPIRRKLQRFGGQGQTIETAWGVGYRINVIDDFPVPS